MMFGADGSHSSCVSPSEWPSSCASVRPPRPSAFKSIPCRAGRGPRPGSPARIRRQRSARSRVVAGVLTYGGASPAAPRSSDGAPRELDLAQRVAAVNEQTAISFQRTCDPTERPLFDLGVPSVERPDAGGEGEVERLFTGLELEVLDRDSTKAEAARLDLRRARCLSLCYGPGGSVDREHVAVADAARDLAGGRSGTAADLEDPDPGPQREGVHQAGESSG